MLSRQVGECQPLPGSTAADNTSKSAAAYIAENQGLEFVHFLA